MAEETLKSAYLRLEGAKRATTDRAEICAKMTLPYAFMRIGTTSQDNLQRNYTQGFGAGLVNTLVGKLAGSILPSSQPFFRLAATEEAVASVAQGNQEAAFQIEKVLAEKENGILRYINNSNFRGSLYPALRLAVITGNCLIEKLPEVGKYRVINLRDYVVSRDYAGRIVELILRETLDKDTLPIELQSKIADNDKQEDIELFTRVMLVDGKYELTQELADEKVGEESTFENITDRFVDIRWNKIDGEDYGRSFVEDCLGTLIALEKQSKVLNEAAVAQSKTVFTVNPNGMTKYKDFVNAKNGGAIIGQEQDIGVVKVQKANDLQMTLQLVQQYKQELEKVFMVFTPRASERTTAYETQKVAQEIEAAFGGVYTHIAYDIQMPLIQEAMKHLKLKETKDVEVIIMSGVQALGRNAEALKVNQMMQEIQMLGQIVNPEEIATALNTQGLITAIVANSGVANKDFIKSSGQQAQEVGNAKQEQISQQLVQQGGQAAIDTAASNAQGA